MGDTSLTPPDLASKKIAALAENIADKYCPRGTVLPEVIISGEGIGLTYGRYGAEFDGIIDYTERGFHIRCNLDRENLPGSPRGRFTLAHELGHYFIDDHRTEIMATGGELHPSICEIPKGQSRREQESNLFASNLLMPPKRYAAFVRKARKRLSGIVDVAGKFKVSLTCAAIRYVTDEIEPSIIVNWSRDGDRWDCISKRFQSAEYGALINNMAGLPANSPTRICDAMGKTRSGVIGQKMAPNVWFPSLNRKPDSKIKLREEAMSLGRYGVLTLLTIVT